MSDAPAAPTLGERLHTLAVELYGETGESNEVLIDAILCIESQSAEIAEMRMQAIADTGQTQMALEALAAANARNARLTEALRANLETLTETRDRLVRYEKAHHEIDFAIDDTRAALIDAQPEQGVEK